jgi:hypothetical protein
MIRQETLLSGNLHPGAWGPASRTRRCDNIRTLMAKPRRLCLVVSLWLRGDGRMESVVRCPEGDGPFEVHVVSFPDEAAFQSYRDDPRLRDLQPLRERAISRTEVRRGELRDACGS